MRPNYGGRGGVAFHIAVLLKSDFGHEVLLSPAGRQGHGVRHGAASKQGVALKRRGLTRR